MSFCYIFDTMDTTNGQTIKWIRIELLLETNVLLPWTTSNDTVNQKECDLLVNFNVDSNQSGTPPYRHLRGYKRLKFFLTRIWLAVSLFRLPFLFSSSLTQISHTFTFYLLLPYTTIAQSGWGGLCKSGAFTLFWWHKDIWWCQFRHYSDYYYSIFSLHSHWLGQFSQIWLTLLNREK